jgi:hypothetical protein
MRQFRCLFFIFLILSNFFACANDLTYINTDYGFEIVFSSDIWKDYKVFAEFTDYGNGISVPVFYIALPTKDPGWYSNLEEGYASIFALCVFTEDQWNRVKAQEGDMFTEIEFGRNNKYIFSESHAHASPADLMDLFFNSEYEIEIFDIE